MASKNKKYAKKKRKSRAGRTFLSFLLIALLVFGTLSVTVLFPIEKISVKGESVYSQAQILEASGIDVGDNIFLLGTRAKQRIITKLPYISEVEFKRYLPDGIVVKVKPATEEYCYYNGKSCFVTDKNNKVLRKASEPDENLFVIKADFKDNLKLADTLILSKEEQKETMAKILDATTQKKLKVTSVDVMDKINIRLQVDDRFNVNLGDYTNVEGKLAHLVASIKEIEDGVTGDINLKSWSPEKPEGYFTAKNIENTENDEQNEQ